MKYTGFIRETQCAPLRTITKNHDLCGINLSQLLQQPLLFSLTLLELQFQSQFFQFSFLLDHSLTQLYQFFIMVIHRSFGVVLFQQPYGRRVGRRGGPLPADASASPSGGDDSVGSNTKDGTV